MIIKHIIFDLGGVLLNLDKQLNEQAFNNYGATKFQEVMKQQNMQQLLNKHETGEISSDDFRAKYIKALDFEVSNTQFDEAYSALLLGIPQERIALLAKLQTKYSLYLLSNTNEIHLQEIEAIYKRDQGTEDFKSFFKALYYSHLIKNRKPNAAAFQTVIDEHKLNTKETLFIDDTKENVEAAIAQGIHAIHLTDDKSILELEKYIDALDSLPLDFDDECKTTPLAFAFGNW